MFYIYHDILLFGSRDALIFKFFIVHVHIKMRQFSIKKNQELYKSCPVKSSEGMPRLKHCTSLYFIFLLKIRYKQMEINRAILCIKCT